MDLNGMAQRAPSSRHEAKAAPLRYVGSQFPAHVLTSSRSEGMDEELSKLPGSPLSREEVFPPSDQPSKAIHIASVFQTLDRAMSNTGPQTSQHPSRDLAHTSPQPQAHRTHENDPEIRQVSDHLSQHNTQAAQQAPRSPAHVTALQRWHAEAAQSQPWHGIKEAHGPTHAHATADEVKATGADGNKSWSTKTRNGSINGQDLG